MTMKAVLIEMIFKEKIVTFPYSKIVLKLTRNVFCYKPARYLFGLFLMTRS